MKMYVLASLLAATIGCGGKKDENKAAATETAKPAPPAPADPATPPPADEKPEPTEKAEDFTHGFCHVTGTGAATFDQKTGHGGPSTLSVMQWQTDKVQEMSGAKEGLILNCLGEHVKLNLLTKKSFPTKTATYAIGKDGEVSVLGSIKHPDEKDGLSLMTQAGTLEITAFDDKHIAGKGELTAKTLPDKGEIRIRFDFDFTCHGHGRCPK